MNAAQPITSWESAPVVLSAADVSQILGLSKPNTYALFRQASFPSIKLSEKRVVCEKTALIRWLNEQAQTGA